MKSVKYISLLLIFILSNCQSFDSIISEPIVSLESVDLAGISFNGVDLVAHINVENPNSFSIPLPKVDWELFVNTASFINGTLTNDKLIKRREKVTLDLPLNLTYEGLYNSFRSLIETKEAAYNIAIGITFPIPLIENNVYNLDFSGVLPLPQLPVLRPGSMKISKIDFSGVEMVWDVNVENPNIFSIPFPEIGWNYDVNGVSLLKSKVSGAGEIASAAVGTALINVSVAYNDVLKAVGSALDSGEIAGNLSLDTALPIAVLAEVKNSLTIQGILPVLRKPEISFQGITKKSLGSTMEFILNWEVDNKNNFEFDIDEFNYDFMVNNSRWAQGFVENPPRVKANGKTLIPLTVSVSALSLLRELVDIINKGLAVDYNCEGSMSFLGNLPGLDKFNIPLNLSGSTRIR